MPDARRPWRALSAAQQADALSYLRAEAVSMCHAVYLRRLSTERLTAEGDGERVATERAGALTLEGRAAALEALVAYVEGAPMPARLDALAGPVCGCGAPSRYEAGWCGACVASPTVLGPPLGAEGRAGR